MDNLIEKSVYTSLPMTFKFIKNALPYTLLLNKYVPVLQKRAIQYVLNLLFETV